MELHRVGILQAQDKTLSCSPEYTAGIGEKGKSWEKVAASLFNIWDAEMEKLRHGSNV